MAKAGSGKRELIDTGNDKRIVRRDGHGRFDEGNDNGRAIGQNDRKHSKSSAVDDSLDATRRAWQKTYENRGKK